MKKVDELAASSGNLWTSCGGYKVGGFQGLRHQRHQETENTMIVLDQIRQRTGIRIEVLSNSEQRFLDYKSIALKGQDFNKIIEKANGHR